MYHKTSTDDDSAKENTIDADSVKLKKQIMEEKVSPKNRGSQNKSEVYPVSTRSRACID